MKLSNLTRKALISFAIIGSCAAAILVYYFNEKSWEKMTLQKRAEPKYQVRAEKTIVPLYANVMGTVTPPIRSTLGAQVTGQITKVKVEQGQQIKTDEHLAEIDGQTYNAELNQAIETRRSLKAQLTQKKDYYERIDRLYQKEAATAIEWEKARSDYHSILSDFDAAEQNVKALSVRYKRTKVTAPYDGIVGKKMVNEGDLVLPGSPLFLVYPLGKMDIEFFVPEKQISFIRQGLTVEVFIESADQHTSAEVYQIQPYANAESGTFLIKASLRDYDSRFAGTFASARFPAGEKLSVLIPYEAIERVGQLEMVHVWENGEWHRRYIRSGESIDRYIEVVSGLNGGELIGYD